MLPSQGVIQSQSDPHKHPSVLALSPPRQSPSPPPILSPAGQHLLRTPVPQAQSLGARGTGRPQAGGARGVPADLRHRPVHRPPALQPPLGGQRHPPAPGESCTPLVSTDLPAGRPGHPPACGAGGTWGAPRPVGAEEPPGQPTLGVSAPPEKRDGAMEAAEDMVTPAGSAAPATHGQPVSGADWDQCRGPGWGASIWRGKGWGGPHERRAEAGE